MKNWAHLYFVEQKVDCLTRQLFIQLLSQQNSRSVESTKQFLHVLYMALQDVKLQRLHAGEKMHQISIQTAKKSASRKLFLRA